MAIEREEAALTELPPDDPAERLVSMNAMLAEWAARSASESASLIERLEAMGYRVRGKSTEEIEEVLKHPPSDASSP